MEAVADKSVLVVPALQAQSDAATSRPEVLTTAHTGVAATGHVVCQGDFFLQHLASRHLAPRQGSPLETLE